MQILMPKCTISALMQIHSTNAGIRMSIAHILSMIIIRKRKCSMLNANARARARGDARAPRACARARARVQKRCFSLGFGLAPRDFF